MFGSVPAATALLSALSKAPSPLASKPCSNWSEKISSKVQDSVKAMILSPANMKTTRLSMKTCGCAKAARGAISNARKASATPAKRCTVLIAGGDDHAAAADRTGDDLFRRRQFQALGDLA